MRIFLSYRRGDNKAMTDRVYKALSDRFGPENVFRDLDDIKAGERFPEKLRSELALANVVVVAMGDRWLSIPDDEGNRRLERPDDWVRVEVEAALTSNARVVPICLIDAPMPTAEDLPDALKQLTSRHTVRVRDDPHFENDVSKLLNDIGSPLRYRIKRALTSPLFALVVVVAIAAVFIVLWKQHYEHNKQLAHNNWRVISEPLRSCGPIPTRLFNGEQVRSILKNLDVSDDSGVAEMVETLKANLDSTKSNGQEVYNRALNAEFQKQFQALYDLLASRSAQFSNIITPPQQSSWTVEISEVEVGAIKGTLATESFRGPADDMTFDGIARWVAEAIRSKYPPDYEAITVKVEMPAELQKETEKPWKEQVQLRFSGPGGEVVEGVRWHVWVWNPTTGSKDHRLTTSADDLNEMRAEGKCFMHIDRVGYQIRIAEIPPLGTKMDETLTLQPWSIRIVLEDDARSLRDGLEGHERTPTCQDEPPSKRLLNIFDLDKMKDLEGSLKSAGPDTKQKEQAINRDRVDFKIAMTKQQAQ